MIQTVDGVVVYTTILDQQIPHVADMEPGPSSLKAGMNVGGYAVETASSQRLVLRARNTSAILKIAGGLLALAVGMVLGYKVFIADASSESSRNSKKFAVIAFLAGSVLTAVGVLQLGEVAEFDGTSRTFKLMRRGSVKESGTGGDGMKVALIFLPQNSSERESVELALIKNDGKLMYPLVKARTDQAQGVLVVETAFAGARLLNLPVSVFGECEKGTPGLKALLPVFA